MKRRYFGLGAMMIAALPLLGLPAAAQDWQTVLDAARGQTVYFHAWGGDPKINDFIAFVGAGAEARYGVKVEQVKLAATSDAVARVQAEKDAGLTSGGAVDLIWINGENFAAMKRAGLLHAPFARTLPNWPLVDVAGKPATVTDFTQPHRSDQRQFCISQGYRFCRQLWRCGRCGRTSNRCNC